MWSLSFRFPDDRLYTFFISPLLISFSSIYMCVRACVRYPYYPISLSDFHVAIFQEAFYQQLHNQAILTPCILTVGILNECLFIRNIHNYTVSYKFDFFSCYYSHCVIITISIFEFWQICHNIKLFWNMKPRGQANGQRSFDGATCLNLPFPSS
jgi:hypothetical protein